MDKTTRNIIIAGSIITFIVIPIIATFILSRTNQPQDVEQDSTSVTELKDRSNDELHEAIEAQSPELADFPFVITKATQPQKGWYVVTIRAEDDPSGQNPARLLLQDTNNGLSLLLGPGTSFDANATDPVGVPDNVAEELNKS